MEAIRYVKHPNVVGAITLMFCLVCIDSASAGVLAPKKPSEAVVLVNSGASCAMIPSGLLLDTQILPDGTGVPFTIPEKRVLVVTGAVARGTGGVAGNTAGITLMYDVPGGFSARVASAPIDSTGVAIPATTLVPNMIVKTPLCCLFTGGATPSSCYVYGFLTRDK